MKVLGICCSPRRHGNSELLLEEALAGARAAGAEVDSVLLSGKDIQFCDGCNTCRVSHVCHVQDDMQPIYSKLLEADGIIFAAPVYMWSVCGQAKTLMDRTNALGHGGLRNKVGASILVAGRAGDTSAFSVFAGLFNIQRMISAGATMAFGLDKGEVRKDDRGMGEARALGRVVVRYVKRMSKVDPDDPLEKPAAMPEREQTVQHLSSGKRQSSQASR